MISFQPLFDLLKKWGISIQQFARDTGISAATWYRARAGIINGKLHFPSTELLVAAVRTLHVPAELLYTIVF